MCTITYYKMGRQWFLDLPDYSGHPDDLERIGSFHEFLELAARGETTLAFNMDIVPFEGAAVLDLTGSSGDQSGGYYHLSLFEEQPVDLELWYNKVIYFFYKELPPRLFLKRAQLH